MAAIAFTLVPPYQTACAQSASAGTRAARNAATSSAIERAEAYFDALQTRFRASDALYREIYPGGTNDLAEEWPYSQVHIATLDLTGMPGATGWRYRKTLADHRRGQMRYWAPTSKTGHPGFESRVLNPPGKRGDLYYDDNEWVGLAALQHWTFFKDEESLDLAKRVFDLVRSGWDREPAHPAPGGIFWTQAAFNSDRNTVSNMPAAKIGVGLFLATGEGAFLADALRYKGWVDQNLRRPDGLYYDHIDLKGRIDRRVWSYNQGVPIGLNVLLFKATGDRHYFDEASRIADASYRYFIESGRIDHEPPPFNAIYFKNLLLLESVTGAGRYRDAMQGYADRMWRQRRDPATGLTASKCRRQTRCTRVIDQAAMVQIEAVLAWAPENWAKLY